jgi:uncharacterized membrane protein YphA (DoxX/SURF4 family)
VSVGTIEPQAAAGAAAATRLAQRAWFGWALLVLRLGLAAVFIAAAIPKIRQPELFAQSIYNYHMLPAWGVNNLAIFLPWLELTLGAGLALGIWRRASATLATGLMFVFMIAFVTAKARGLDVSCGCFEVGTEAAPSNVAWVVLRDLGLLAVALVLVKWDGGPRLWAVGRKAGVRAGR